MEKLFELLFGDLIKKIVEQFLSNNLAEKVEAVVGEKLSSFENVLLEMDAKVSEMQTALENFIDNGEPQEPPIEEPVDDLPRLEDGYPNFRRIAQSEWAQTVNGNRVGYVRLGDKYGLMIDSGNKVLAFYQNSSLRGSTDTIASRIIAPAGSWIMVWASGDVYHSILDQRVRPYAMDGGRLAFIVMKEQMIDGIQLDMDLPEYDAGKNPKLYIPNDKIVEVFYQEKAIDWTVK